MALKVGALDNGSEQETRRAGQSGAQLHSSSADWGPLSVLHYTLSVSDTFANNLFSSLPALFTSFLQDSIFLCRIIRLAKPRLYMSVSP